MQALRTILWHGPVTKKGSSWNKPPRSCKPLRNVPASQQLTYQGALTPTEAYYLIQQWKAPYWWMSVARLSGNLLAWYRCIAYRTAQFPRHAAQSAVSCAIAGAVDKQALLLLMCRSGVRSHEAAVVRAAAAGYPVYTT
jgi:rhodanese-related sulfurtransferase